jgi:hypothetical protein
LENLPFSLKTQRRSLIGVCKVDNQMVKLRIYEESHSKFVLVCLAASIYVILAAHEVHLVSWIAAIAILFFRSLLIVIRRPPVLYSDRTFQVAIRRSFLCLLLVFIVLSVPFFSFSSFLINVFSVDRELARRTTP